ncbi:MAG: hypothetical protein ACR2OG_13355, partial [Gemmatimonadaceae bacterium]
FVEAALPVEVAEQLVGPVDQVDDHSVEIPMLVNVGLHDGSYRPTLPLQVPGTYASGAASRGAESEI